MPYPLADFVYSEMPTYQKCDDKAHENSNWLMNLFEAICKVYHPDYCSRGHVVYLAPAEWLYPLAESFITRLGHGFTRRGNGFGHALARSISPHSAHLSREDWEAMTRKVMADPRRQEADRVREAKVDEYAAARRKAKEESLQWFQSRRELLGIARPE